MKGSRNIKLIRHQKRLCICTLVNHIEIIFFGLLTIYDLMTYIDIRSCQGFGSIFIRVAQSITIPKITWTVKIRNPSIYNILRWVAWMMEQTNRRPKVWYSKYYSFYTFYRLRAIKTLYLYFCNL